MQIRADSTEYAEATITADHDISGNTIEVALPTTGQAPSSWVLANVLSVEQDFDTGNWTATYRILIGPSGAITLNKGTYDWLVRVTDNPEIPVRKAGTVTVTT